MKNDSFVEITLDCRHIGLNDERKAKMGKKCEMAMIIMVNKGTLIHFTFAEWTLHSFHFIPFNTVGMCYAYEMLSIHCSQLAYYFISFLSVYFGSFSYFFHFLSLLPFVHIRSNSICTLKFHQRVNKYGHVQHPSVANVEAAYYARTYKGMEINAL